MAQLKDYMVKWGNIKVIITLVLAIILVNSVRMCVVVTNNPAVAKIKSDERIANTVMKENRRKEYQAKKAKEDEQQAHHDSIMAYVTTIKQIDFDGLNSLIRQYPYPESKTFPLVGEQELLKLVQDYGLLHGYQYFALRYYSYEEKIVSIFSKEPIE